MEHTSYSGINLHRKCPQAWSYRYVERVEEADDSPRPPLIFGTWWHAVCAADGIERSRVHSTAHYVPEALQVADNAPSVPTKGITVAHVLELAEDWWRKQDEEVREAVEDYLGQDLPRRLRHAYGRWTRRWKAERESEAVLGIEVPWEKEISEGVMLHGAVDEVFLDLRRQIVVVRDHKTGKTLGEGSTVDDLMDSQLHLYAWGVSEQVESWGRGKVRAVAYDRVRSLAPKTPRLNKNGTLSKSVKDFDLDTYLEWSKGPDGSGVPFEGLRKDGTGAGLYQAEDEVVARLRAEENDPSWFQRTLTPLSKPVIRSHLRAAAGTGQSMEGSRQEYQQQGEAQRNLSVGNCRWCPFKDLCRAQMFGAEVVDDDLSLYGLKRR